MTRSKILGSVFALLIALLVALTQVAYADHGGTIHHGKRNAWDQYRWPWVYSQHWRITQGWEGPVSHGSTTNFRYAVDYSKTGGGGNQPIAAARDGTASCQLMTTAGLGWVVRVTHGTDSDIYAHQNACHLSVSNVFVAQGRMIGYTGTYGSEPAEFDDHLHFQVNINTTGHTSKTFTMEGLGSQYHSSAFNQWADSDNLSAGYTVPAISWEPAIHDKYQARGGWAIVGSTAGISGWTPGRSPATLCGSGTTPGWYQCNFTDINSTSRSGRVQTFKGAGSGFGEHAIFKPSSANATFMSRGLLGPYTNQWTTGKDGFYFMGYPNGDSYSIGGGQVRMDFQNGWETFSTCASTFYW